MTSSHKDLPARFVDCPICSQIDALETAFSKYGWPDHDLDMAAAVHQLIPAETLDTRTENHHLRVCPRCGTYYRYDITYEYLVNGSEDTTTLLRLAPADARRLLSDAEYALRMQQVALDLQHPDPRLRRFAGACLVSHHLHQADCPSAHTFLLAADSEAAKGAVVYLMNLVDNYAELLFFRQVDGLDRVLAEAAQTLKKEPENTPRHDLGILVGYLRGQLFP
jgi:hypothetical protein